MRQILGDSLVCRCHFLATFISNTGNIKKLLQLDKAVLYYLFNL
jgi:hypothetical protein